MEWISVKDRLPKDGEWVDGWILPDGSIYGWRSPNIFFKDGLFRRKQTIWKDSGAAEITSHVLENITHWMPLPEPPKDQK